MPKRTSIDGEDIEMGEKTVLDMPETRRRSWRHQTSALVQKSATNQWRQYKTNVCQMAFPVVMIILLFIIQQLVNSFLDDQDSVIPAFVHPPTLPFTLLQTNLTINQNCVAGAPIMKGIDLVYVDQTDSIGSLVANYTPLYPPTIMYEGEVFVGRGNLLTTCKQQPFIANPFDWTEYESKEDSDSFLYSSQKVRNIQGGYIFNEVTASSLKLNVYFNETLTRAKDLPVFLNLIGDLFLKSFTRARNQTVTTMLLNGARNFPTKAGKVTFDLIAILGPRFFIYVYQLIFPVILGNIVYEKEYKLREIMKMMGLRMTTYWIVTYVFSFMLYFIALMVMWALAAALGFRYFVANSPAIVFLLIFIWGHTLTALAFFFSVFFNRSRTAVVVGYIWVFASGLLAMQVVGDYFDNANTPYAVIFILMCIPPFTLYRGLDILGTGIVGNLPGWTWDDLAISGMQTVFAFLVVQWFIFLILALYLDAVLKTGYGTKLSPIFFLKPSFWRKEKVAREQLKEQVEGEAADVAAMRSSMIKNPNKYFMRIEDLHKVYPGDRISGLKEKIAVKSLALGVYQGECFGFLGPNGAGKSTTINILSGLYRASGGTAIIDGMDINEDSDVAMVMGVCPQDNVLWDNLTGPEHLKFYGRIKNYSGKELDEMVEAGLRAVSLWEDRKKQSHQFSGGMKRRLSVACSLMGNPKLVLLDEPSTGLDPASRRDLWQLISNQKNKCAMLLTTHAMEEADALCDRIGIFMNGELRCLGTSGELKLRYGKGYRISLTVDPKKSADPTEFVRSIASDASLLNSIAGTYHYEVLKSSVKLSTVFQTFEAQKEQYGITDWGISNTTLEEVFLKITGEDKEMLKLSEHGNKSPENSPAVKTMAMDPSSSSDSENDNPVGKEESDHSRGEIIDVHQV